MMRRHFKFQISDLKSQIAICFAVVCLANLTFFSELSLSADARPKVRHVFVPSAQPKVWPKPQEELEQVPFEEYELLLEANREKPAKRHGAHIAWQSLSSTFDAARGVLTGGRWTAEIRGDAARRELMSLGSLDVALSELRWSDGDAVWGTAPSGESLLLVDATQRRLEGKFSLQGRRLRRTWQFDVRLASATVSELILRVPAEYAVKCEAGKVRGSRSSGEEGWRLWQIDLGSLSRCEVLVMESTTSAPTESVVVYEQTSSYVLREAEVELQCEITAEVFHTPKATLTFTVSDDLSIYSVGFAGDVRLPWRDLPRVPGQARQIEVNLPEPQLGRLRTLQVLAGTVAKWEASLSLPRLMLSGGWFVGGRWNVAVDTPLVWRAMRPVGLRLTEVDANSPNVRRLSFLQYLADASLAMDVSYPEPRLSARCLQVLHAQDNEWRISGEWHWQSSSGVTFATRSRVPPGWEILDVQSLAETMPGEVRHWDVVTEASGERVLICEFSRPLEGRSTQRLRIEARRPRSLTAERESFEGLMPLDCRHVDELLAVTIPAGWRWDSPDEAVPAPTSLKPLAELWQGFDLWKSESARWSAATLLRRTTQVNTPLRPTAAFARELRVPAATTSDNEGDKPPPASGPVTVSPVDNPLDVEKGSSEQTTTSRTDKSSAFRTAVTEQLVWTSAELRSLIFPGGDGHDVHWLTLQAAQVTRVGRLEFELSEPAELVSVRMNAVRTEVECEGSRFRLPSIPQGGLQTLEIQYRVPSDTNFLWNRQSIPVPRVDAPVLGFRWQFALPPNARLAEEPSHLRLLQSLDPTPWLRRLFGPLGRDSLFEWFNPLSRRSWQELWPTDQRPREDERSESRFAPLGWRIRVAVSPTLPAEVTWVTWNADQVRILAWISLLFSLSIGCLLRRFRVQPRVHIAAMWLGVCTVGVVLSAPVYAEVLGGCLMGTLIAVLIPRRLVMSYSAAREARARGAFETTVAIQRVSGAFLLSAGVVCSAFAAEEPKSEIQNLKSEIPTFDVLIPVDSPTDALAELVQPSLKLPWAFVPKVLMDLWREQRLRDSDPEVLIASARYVVQLDDQQPSVQAEFFVHRLVSEKPVQIRFPFASVPLAGTNSCLVDGLEHRIDINAKRDALLLDLPARERLQTDDGRSKVITHRVTFEVLPPMQSIDNLSRLKLSVPPVLASQLIVKSPQGSDVEASTRRGEATTDSAGRTWTAQLGKFSHWSMDWSRSGTSRPRTIAEVNADVFCLAEFTPMAVRQRYRVRYAVSSGQVNEVTWVLPRGVLIRDGDVLADDLLQWSLESVGDGRQRCVMEFSKPQTDEFTVDVAGHQPPLGTSENPRWEPWNIDASATEADRSTGGGRVKLQKFALGLTTLPGFKIVPQPVDLEHTLPLTKSDFLKGWANVTLPRSPQVTLQLHSPTGLMFDITPLLPQRVVRQELLLKLGRRWLDWELHAEVTAKSGGASSGAPAFQHDLTLSPQFRVDEVSVTEDEAERLVSWTNNDQHLALFLRGETSGIQNVFLQGRDTVPADGRLTIPTRWFDDAEIADFSVRVRHDPSWQVQVLDDREQPLTPVETGGAVVDRPELFLGKFRAEAGSPTIIVQLTPHVPASSARAWTIIAAAPNNAWLWRHAERFLDNGMITARLFWPNSWAANGSVKLSPALKELSRRPVPDGFELTVQSLDEVDAPREVLFETQPLVGDVSSWRIAPPHALEVRERQHGWLIAEEMASWLTPPSETRPWQDASALSESVRRHLPTTTTAWSQVLVAMPTLELIKPERMATPPAPKTVWMDTTVWVADGVISQGRTWLLLQPNGLQELTLPPVDGVHWLAAFVGDTPREVPADAGAMLTISGLPNEPLVWLSIFWSADGARRDRIVARHDAQLPVPADAALKPARHDLTLISSGNSDLSSTRGARRVEGWDGRLSRAMSLLRGLHVDPAVIDGSLKRLWRRVQEDFDDAQRLIEELPTEVGSGAMARQRLQAVKAEMAELESLRSHVQLATTSDAFATSRWVSDTWSQVPSSWSAIADPDQNARLSVIVVDRRWLTWFIAVLSIVAVIPLFRAWLRWETGEWLAAHPYLAWASLGIIWWSCLAPSVFGFGMLVLATVAAVRDCWHQTPVAVPLRGSNPHVIP